MKKFMLIFLTILLFTASVNAEDFKIYNLYLGTSTVSSGNTMEASGTSDLILEGQGFARSNGQFTLPNMDEMKGPYTIQLVSSSVSPYTLCTSGTTFTVKWKESDVDSANHWAALPYFTIPGLNGIDLSGNTLYKYQFTPGNARFIRLYLESGVTPLNEAKFQLITRKDGNQKPSVKRSSGTISTDTAIATGPGEIVAVVVYTNGTNESGVSLYDNPSAASGTLIMPVTVVGSDYVGGEVIPTPFEKGLYADVSGTGAQYRIIYKLY